MSLRRLDRTAVFLAIASTLALASEGQAQLSDGQWRLMQANTGRLAVEVRPQPTMVFTQPGMHSSLFRQPVSFSLLPTVTMSDGTVFANFGRGFEPVQRSCGYAAVVVGQPRVIGSNGVVLRQAVPPTYTQPVPAQMTASQQMLPSVQAQAAAGRGAGGHAQAECFGRDGSGFSRDGAGRAIGHRY